MALVRNGKTLTPTAQGPAISIAAAPRSESLMISGVQSQRKVGVGNSFQQWSLWRSHAWAVATSEEHCDNNLRVHNNV